MKTTAKLSFMMFVEWFIWGAWFVPLWLWLSKSGFSAGEIGWSYACTAIAAILSPILVGSITDRFFSAQKVLAVLMFAGALLMYFAAQQTTFAGFFPLLLAYSLTYMPTIALTNSIAFANVPDVERDFPRIRVMGTIGWIASGLACGFLPQILGYADISPTNIPLLITAGSSALLGVFAFFLPDTLWVNKRVVKCPEEVAQQLAVEAGSDVFLLKRIRYVDEEAVSIEESWVPAHLIHDVDAIGISLYDYFRSQHIYPQRTRSRVSARMPDAEFQSHIQLDSKIPVLVIKQVALDQQQRPIEYSISHCRSDLYVFVCEE